MRKPRPRKPGGLGNRTDIAASTLPTGQPYGQRGRQERALAAVPTAPSTPAGPMGAPPSPDDAAAAMPFNPVGLGSPTERPDEPVTAGLPVGPGPGPGAMMPQPPAGPNPDVLLYAKWMPALELLANSPTASSQTRQFYRRLRSQMPVAASPKVSAADDEVGAALGAQGVAPSPPSPTSTNGSPPPASRSY